MLKKIFLGFLFFIPSIIFGQDTSKVIVDSIGYDTTGLYYFLYGGTDPYDYNKEKTVITDSLINVFSERLPQSLGLNLIDTLTNPKVSGQYVLYLETNPDGWESIPSELERWAYNLYLDMFFELTYLKISSGQHFECLSLDITTDCETSWEYELYWKVTVKVDLE